MMKLGLSRWKLFYFMVSRCLAENAMFSGMTRIQEWGGGHLDIFAFKNLREPKMLSCQALIASFIFAFSSMSLILLPPPATQRFCMNSMTLVPVRIGAPYSQWLWLPVYQFATWFYDFITWISLIILFCKLQCPLSNFWQNIILDMKIEVINRDAASAMATVYWISSVVKVAGNGIMFLVSLCI